MWVRVFLLGQDEICWLAMLSLVSICFLVTLTLVPLSRYVHSKMFVTEKVVWSKSWNQTQPSPASPMGPQLSQACTPFTRCAFKMTTCKIDHLHQKREQCKSQASQCCLLTVSRKSICCRLMFMASSALNHHRVQWQNLFFHSQRPSARDKLRCSSWWCLTSLVL